MIVFLLILDCLCDNFSLSLTNNWLFLESNDNNCIYDRIYNSRSSNSQPLCLYNCTFQSIRSSYSKGGAVYISYSTINSQSNHFENCIFTNCLGSEGGSLYINTTQQSTTEIYNCSFDKSTATTSGGSLSISNSIFSLFECHFSNNGISIQNKGFYGGSLYFSKSEGTITKCKFINDYSSFQLSQDLNLYSYGGTIYHFQTNTTFDECYFYNNTVFTKKQVKKLMDIFPR